MYEPKLRELVILKSRVSPEVWAARVREARAAERVMKRIAKKKSEEGKSLNEAVREALPASKRSWAVRRWKRYQRDGFEGLFDTRVPPEPRVTRACQELVVGARLGNPKLTVDEALQVLTVGRVKPLPSASTIKRLFKKADDARRWRERKEQETRAKQVEELELAGGELLKAAEAETGGVEALVEEVEKLAEEAQEDSEGREPQRDVARREEGKFTAAYNRARRRKKGQKVASYLRPAEEKGRRKVPSVFGFVHQGRESVRRKVAALVYEALVNPTKGWDGLRSVAGEGLESLVGYAYMPATLQKLCSELSQLGAGPRLLEVVGVHWHSVATERWGEGGAMAALYVDNHAKEVWSSLLTMAGKVSHRSRVMPCITTTYVQTGAGTPVYVLSQSGSAPLAPRLGELVKKAEERLDQDVRRAVVIDSEGSTFDILESFARQKRIIVTPCKPSRLKELELHYAAGSYFRPYREHDELRVATATLRHKSTERELEIGALVVRREHRESDTVLLTTGLALGAKGRELADLYFVRWPLQENFFKNGVALGLDRHRGNCGRMVTNVAIATELEGLEVRLATTEQKLGRLSGQTEELERKVAAAEDEHDKASIELAVRRQQVDQLVGEGRTGTKEFARAAAKHHEMIVRTEATEPALHKAKAKLERHHAQRQDAADAIEKLSDRIGKLEPLRKIRQLDVALDTILTAMKLTAAMIIAFVLREYMPTARMATETFLARVLTIRGRREKTAEQERIVFYENPRDPQTNAALAEACERLNERSLVRDGRALHYALEQPP